MTRAQLIARAETEIFTDGRVALDTHVAMLGEGLDAASIEQQIESEIDKEI